MTAPDGVVLASASPRRAALLTQIGVPFRQVPAEIDETHPPAEALAEYVLRLARQKARAGWQRQPAGPPVVGGDTAVELDQELLGKPADRAQALAMLEALSGRTHRVLSAVGVCSARAEAQRLSISEVDFRVLARWECEAYWRTGEPQDKAGAYGLQGRGAMFVQALRGSYSGVVGLPLCETAELLAAVGHGGLVWSRTQRTPPTHRLRGCHE